MSYKVTRRSEAVAYEAPGHYDMRPTRLHNPGDVTDGRITVGLSHFLPGGGCHFGSNALESIYYVLAGEMDLTTDDGTTTRHPKGHPKQRPGQLPDAGYSDPAGTGITKRRKLS